VATRVRITGLDARTVKSDIELEWDGRVVVRIIGWVDRRFDSDEGLWLMLRLPEDHLLASPMPGGVLYVDERWKDSASRELLARRYFHASELAAYEAMNPRRQRSFLLGRIAAKDAVRKACWDAGHGDMFPAELTVGNEPSGRPFVSGSGTEGLHVSLAHCQWVGVALVGTRPDLGVDVERIEPRSEQASGSFVTDAERALLPVNDDEWLTRAWSAKEAAAKAAGTGLGGRPKDFVINAVDGERLLVGDRWVSTVSMRKEHVVAWTDPNP
jgi:phosphopantetheinyl transferase (holo-ACP synthase)